MNKLELGDVIQSTYFVYGWKEDFSKEVIDVGSYEGKRIIGCCRIPKFIPRERATLNPDEEARKVDHYLLDLSVVDESRKNALYVVEQLADIPTIQGATDEDLSEGGLLAHARRLNEDKTYNNVGELLRFYVSGNHRNRVSDFRKIGKMKMSFVDFQEGK